MVLPRPVSAVVFDMDGLLIDTEVVYREAIMAAAAACGVDLPLWLFHRMIGAPITQNRELLMAHYGEGFDFDGLIEAATHRFHDIFALEDRLKAGVVELLDHLDEAGLPRAIATSSGHDSVERHLRPNGVLDRFHAVVARGDYVNGKPAPDPFLAAARRLGVAPEACLALEDSHNGIRAAHAAGMMAVMVPDLLEPTEEMRALAVAIADSLHDVREWLAAARSSSSPSLGEV
ncbi:MAG TPA: HAD family phosphatase, partial [Caulobacteraceae bacterium]|nr:HAD family phosphatase [Caulobacteraceae bacterium]